MYIGGVGSTGLHHLVWEILDNAVDEAMNGHASNIALTLHKDGASVTVSDDGRGIPVDKHPKTKTSALEVIFTTLHAGGKFEGQSYKTAGRPARRRRLGRQRALARAGRDGQARRRDLGAEVQAGDARRRREEARPGARDRHDGLLPARPDDLPEDRSSSPTVSRAAGGRQLPAQRRQDHRSRTRRPRRPTEREVFQHDEGLADYLRKILEERKATAGSRVAVRAEARARGDRPAARPGAAVDRVDRRAPAQLRERHSDRVRRHARERPARRASARPSATSSTRTTCRRRASRSRPRTSARAWSASSASSSRSRSSRARPRIGSTTPR